MDADKKERIRHGAELLKSLSHPIRLCLVRHLALNQELNVSWFVGCMDASQSSISQHLALLRHLGIVSARQEGPMQFYRLENRLLGEVALLMTQNGQDGRAPADRTCAGVEAAADFKERGKQAR